MEESGKTSLSAEHLNKLTELYKESSRNPERGTKPEMLAHLFVWGAPGSSVAGGRWQVRDRRSVAG